LITIDDSVMQTFDSLILHDLPITNLSLFFEEKKAVLVLEEYNDLTDSYQPLTLSFLGLNKFISKYPDKYEFSVIGCKDATCKKTEYKKANLATRYEKMEWFEKNNLVLPEWV
jgi:hypothetical protein